MDIPRSFSLHGLFRTPGTVVFLSPEGELNFSAFARFAVLQGTLAERVLLVQVRIEDIAHVPMAQRSTVSSIADGVVAATVRFGFDDDPDVPQALAADATVAPASATAHYYVSPDQFGAVACSAWPAWRKRLFAIMARASVSTAEYFHLPLDRTTELSSA